MYVSFLTLTIIFCIGFLIGALISIILFNVKKLPIKIDRILLIFSSIGFLFSFLVTLGLIDTKSELVNDCEIRLNSICNHGFVKDFNITLLRSTDAGIPMVQIATPDTNEIYPLAPGRNIDHSDFIIFCKRLIYNKLKVEGAIVDIYFRYGNRFFKSLNRVFIVLSFIGLVFSSYSIKSKTKGKKKKRTYSKHQGIKKV